MRFTTLILALAAIQTGCSSTSVSFSPQQGQAPVCQAPGDNKAALVLWTTAWRSDQKDVPQREAAADEGIRSFFSDSKCFAKTDIERVDPEAMHIVRAPVGVDKVVTLSVRELGPVVKLLSSPALINGGTEAVIDVAVYTPGAAAAPQRFSTHWQNGGPGVIKGVKSLPADMSAALAASLQQH